jgi:hypothetical protein
MTKSERFVYIVWTKLNEFEIIEIIEFYDFPRLFIAKKDETYYIGLCIEENDGILEFLYLGVSEKRLDEIKSKKLTLYDSFKNPEYGYILKNYYNENGTISSEQIYPADLSDDILPNKGVFIS